MIPVFRLTRFAIPFAVFLLLVLFFWKGLGSDPRQLPSALMDQPVPEFALPALANPKITLDRSLFKGQVSVLHVWATWCGTCQSEHPFWVDRARAQEVVLYGLLFKDARYSAQAWLKAHENPYREIIDDEAGRLARELGVYGTPETFLIDREGRVRYRQAGPIDQRVWTQEFVPRIKALEAQGARPGAEASAPVTSGALRSAVVESTEVTPGAVRSSVVRSPVDRPTATTAVVRPVALTSSRKPS